MLRAEVPEEHLLETSNAGAKSPKRPNFELSEIKGTRFILNLTKFTFLPY